MEVVRQVCKSDKNSSGPDGKGSLSENRCVDMVDSVEGDLSSGTMTTHLETS